MQVNMQTVINTTQASCASSNSCVCASKTSTSAASRQTIVSEGKPVRL